MRTGFLRGFALCLVFVMLFSSACFAEDLSPKEDFLTVGNVVTFGHYEQDGDESNGPEPIEWLVLDVQDGKALLLSKYGLDAKPYNTMNEEVTWKTCTLRSWLNEDFVNAAFTEKEQSAILLTDVDNSGMQKYSEWWSAKGGENTQDKVFLLSYAEANRYLGVEKMNLSNKRARLTPTAYAVSNGAWFDYSYMTEEENPAGSWWLRSPGHDQKCAAFVFKDGSLSDNGVYSESSCVRPSLWVDPESANISAVTKYPASEPEGTPPSVWTSLVKAGDVVTFGSYEQDNNPDNGPEPIEWIVLDVQNGKALLLSKYGLDVKPYNAAWTDVTWETCTLRAWLNGDFMNAAFSEMEQSAILLTDVNNDGFDWTTVGARANTYSGNNTQDKVFLLSLTEANHYLETLLYSDRRPDRVYPKAQMAPTAYAVIKGGAWTSEKEKTEDGDYAGIWWLRTTGNTQFSAVSVDTDGSMQPRVVDKDSACARPAIWLDLEADPQKAESADISVTTQEAASEHKEAPIVDISLISIGSVITFGHYEQDGDESNGPEPIEWTVLDVQDGKLLLLSKYGLDAKPYNTELARVTWETCSLRSWLNKDFLNTAFSAEEQSAILLKDVDNSEAQGFDWAAAGRAGMNPDGGNNTQDKVFLLSWREAEQYLESSETDYNNPNKVYPKALVAPTAYALKKGAWTKDNQKTEEGASVGFWFLRSPGKDQIHAAGVFEAGSLGDCDVNIDRACVRPSLWLDPEPDPQRAESTNPPVTTQEPLSRPEETPKLDRSLISIGAVITFGYYEQDYHKTNGPEPIEWIVLDVQDGKVLLLSKYGLDAKAYNTEWKKVTWETCTLRNWLNGDFMNTAFTKKEQSAILLTEVDNSESQGFDWTVFEAEENPDGGNNTQDKVFLLSWAEARRYLEYSLDEWTEINPKVQVAPTVYAFRNGASASDRYKTEEGAPATQWWLRSPGAEQDNAIIMNDTGLMGQFFVFIDSVCVRPALWLDLNSDIFD